MSRHPSSLRKVKSGAASQRVARAAGSAGDVAVAAAPAASKDAAPAAEAPAAEAPAPDAAAPRPADVSGRNVSGRSWKPKASRRSSALKSGPPRKSWAEKTADREERSAVREKEAELVEERKARILESKKYRDAKKARKQRNEFKNARYQVITNEHTVKSMSKKQLRQVKRTRVSQEGEIELVDAYAPTRDAKKPRR